MRQLPALALRRRHQHFAVAVGLHRRHEARALHLLDQTRGAVVADAQVPLHERDRRPPGLEHDRHRLVVHRIGFGVGAFDRHAVGVVACDAAFEQSLDVLRLAQLLQVLDDAMHFAVRHERAVHALRVAGSRRQEQHVALAEQRLGAHLVENRARVDLARHLERNARRNVRLDEAGDHVDRRTLRGEDEMDAGGARLLRDARDELLDLLAGHHHEVGQLVDHDDDQRHFFERLGLVRRQRQRIQELLAGLLRLGDLRVVAGEVAHAELRHQPVAALHFADAPVERVGGELHVGDHRRQQMRDAFVHRQLEHLRIDQDQAHLLRLGLVEERQDHRVDGDRLARARRARDQQVRHAREIGHHRLAGDVLAQRERQRARRVVVRRRREDLDELHHLPPRIRQFEAHARLAGNRLDHADRHDRQRARDVLDQVDDLRALHADGGLDFVARDHRSRIGRQHLGADAEVGELALDEPRRVFERLGADRLLRATARPRAAPAAAAASRACR